MNPRTYREMLDYLDVMSDEQLDKPIMVETYGETDSRDCYVAELRIAGKEHNSLPEGHPVVFVV